jgi:tripartite-type tricarboxylate transporter receptor subunit TctC
LRNFAANSRLHAQLKPPTDILAASLHCVVAAVAVLSAACVHAQSYPVKPVRLVVPFPPGGGTDVVGRLIAQHLTQALAQQVLVDNRPGAAGRIGAEYVAHAASDGYILLMATTTVIITAPALFPKLAYDALKDFAPIAPVASGTYVLVVHPSVPARSVKELIALAKSRPGQLNFASSGPGDTNHLSGELFQIQADVRMTHVPYKGAAPGTISVIMGETDLMFSNIVPAIPPVKSGQLRALGITSLKRSPMLPEVPTIAESGLPGFEVQTLYAILAPAGTPDAIVQRLNAEIGKALRAPEVKHRLEADGSQVMTSTPEELGKLMVTEISKWTRVIRRAGIKPAY